ncbi:MAG: SoxY-related AACIE arm protein [Burkholderiales bacterium]|nr:SoxY-related AACIE arm protein [Burkholderiales bacterium]
MNRPPPSTASTPATPAPRTLARQRRRLLVQGVASMFAGTMGFAARPASATPQALREAVAAFTGGAEPRSGRVRLELAELVENGNAVPVTVSVQSPMTEADHVRRIALFTERNPDPGVAIFHFSPRNGRAWVSTRMRLATSQQVLALAQMNDGSCWQATMDVVVTLAACVEG